MRTLKAIAPIVFCGVLGVLTANLIPGVNFFELFVCNMLGIVLTIVWMKLV